ncbi:MAG: hypothetical protein RRA35_14180, partial [Desulfomonilia bacterium]|nr:hypothetical protein [Desulfomonilia bacterium]
MDYNFFNDRRRDIRKPIQARVSVQLTELIKGEGYVKDVTPGSACIVSPELFAFFAREHTEIFQNNMLTITLPAHGLNLEGKIIRVEEAKYELVVKLSRISNPETWKKL